MPPGNLEKAVHEQTETFTGRGNNETEARESAKLRYNNWQLLQKRAGLKLTVYSEKYSCKQNNEINFKCDLVIEYTKHKSGSKTERKSLFNLISNIVRTIKP